MVWRSVIFNSLIVAAFVLGLSVSCNTDAHAQEEPEIDPDEVAVEPVPGEWVTATAYCLPGITASGRPVSQVVVAGGYGFRIGERLEVPGYGTRTVLDRGWLAWNQIDIWMPSCADAIRFGRQSMLIRRIN